MKIKVGIDLMLETALQHRIEKEPKRNYVGVTSVTDECDRKVFYKIHHPELAEPIPPRVSMIFSFGHAIEKIVVNLLAETGMECWDVDQNGYQFERKYKDTITGHCDLILKGLPESSKAHVVEIKSCNDKGFKSLKDGVEAAFPDYYRQLLMYLFMFELNDGLFIFVNKNDSEIYTERVKANNILAESYLKRGIEITEMKVAPERKHPSKTYYKCRYCEFNSYCWSKENV